MTIIVSGDRSYASRGLRIGLMVPVMSALIVVLAGVKPAAATVTPSNEQLYQMIVELKAEVRALRVETRKAKSEAAAAQSQLARARQHMEQAAETAQPSAFDAMPEPTRPKEDQSGFFAGGELVMMKFSREGGSTDTNNSPADFDYAPGYRMEIGYQNEDKAGIRGRFFHLADSTTSDDGDNVLVTVQTADLEAFTTVQLTPDLELEAAAGARWARLDGSSSGDFATFPFAAWGADLGVQAVGGTAVLEARHRLGPGQLYAHGRFSLLAGEAYHHIRQNPSGIIFNSPQKTDGNVVTISELGLGYSWEHDWQGLTVFGSAGVEGQIWTNAVPGLLPNVTDASLTGFNFKVGVRN
jgi:outer membrane murein-binding lipoprotein Lpp